jgi:hypothetical protein
MDEVGLSPEEETRWREIRLDYDSYQQQCEHCKKPVYRVIKAPKEIDIEVWEWKTLCWKCSKETSVIWPSRESSDFMNESLTPETFKNLPAELQKIFPFFKIVEKKTMETIGYGNTCSQCGAYQGDWYVGDELLEVSYRPEKVKKNLIHIHLTEEEQLLFAHPKKVLKMHYPRKGLCSSLCDSCFALHRKKTI